MSSSVTSAKASTAAVTVVSVSQLLPHAVPMASMRKSGKLIIVSEYYAPDRSTTATYVTAIAEGLSADTEVLVISGTAQSASVAPLKTN